MLLIQNEKIESLEKENSDLKAEMQKMKAGNFIGKIAKNDISRILLDCQKLADVGKKYEKLAPCLDRPRCMNGSLDMRYGLNRGLSKYGIYESKQQGPSA